MKQKHSLVLFIFLGLVTPVLQAGPLTEATVTKIINDVKLVDPAAGAHTAKLNDVIKGDLGLRTGLKSRSELLFEDNTLTRIGPESYFSFQSGTRDLTLDRGTLLLQVPKGIGGARIHTAAITASITGTTIMMEHIPGRSLKVLVLEGSLRLSVNGQIGDSVLLLPGRMVIMPTNAKRIPDPVTVDLRKVVSTSSLVNMRGKKGAVADTLPSAQLIEHEIQQQDANIGHNNLAETNLVILGKGTTTLIANDNLMDTLARHADADPDLDPASNSRRPPPPVATPTPVVTPTPVPTPTPVATPNPTPNPAPTPNPNPPPVGTPAPPPPVGYTTNGSTVVNTTTAGPNVNTSGVPFAGVIYTNLTTNGSPSAFLFDTTSAFDNEVNFDAQFLLNIQTSAVFDFSSLQLGGLSFNKSGGANNVVLVGDNGITNSPAATINLSGINGLLLATEAGNVVLDSGISFLATGADSAKFVEIYARGGDALIGATFNLPQSALQVLAENNANFGGTAAVTAQSFIATGLQSVHFDGTANINQVFQLNGGAVELGGTVTANSGFIYGSSASIGGSFSGQQFTSNVTGDFTLTNTGTLTDTDPSPLAVTAGGNIVLDGTVTGQQVNLTATNGLEIGGSFTTGNAFTANAATATFNGILNVQTANVQTTGDFVLNAGGSLTSAQGVTIHSSSGNITLDAGVTGHNVTLTAADNIAINQAIVPQQLVVTGGSISFGTDQSMTSSPNNDLTSTNGNIDATGHALSGFDQVSVTNGNFMAGSLSANTLLVSGTGNVVVSGNLVLAQPFTGNNNLTIGGLFSDQTISAGTASIEALKTNSLTLAGALTLVSSELSPFSGNNTVSLTAPSITFTAGAILDGNPGTAQTGPGNAANLTISTGAFTLAAPLSLNGGDAAFSSNNGGANGGTLNLTSSGTITLNAPITATTGQNSLTTTSGGNGGTVNLTANDTITLNDKIQVSSNSGQRVSHGGGNINVTSSKSNGVAISVTSSAQLLALLNAAGAQGGTIKFVSSGANSAVNVNGATLRADNGTVEVDNSGSSGTVNLTNAAIHANALKVSAMGPNGTLNIGGGTLDANSVIELYAVGSNGSVNFVDNVTLSGNSVKTIAGDSVTIFNGKVVTVLGSAPANVFTNHANYMGFGGNGSTSGTFAGQGANNPKPLSQAPGY